MATESFHILYTYDWGKNLLWNYKAQNFYILYVAMFDSPHLQIVPIMPRGSIVSIDLLYENLETSISPKPVSGSWSNYKHSITGQ